MKEFKNSKQKGKKYKKKKNKKPPYEGALDEYEFKKKNKRNYKIIMKNVKKADFNDKPVQFQLFARKNKVRTNDLINQLQYMYPGEEIEIRKRYPLDFLCFALWLLRDINIKINVTQEENYKRSVSKWLPEYELYKPYQCQVIARIGKMHRIHSHKIKHYKIGLRKVPPKDVKIPSTFFSELTPHHHPIHVRHYIQFYPRVSLRINSHSAFKIMINKYLKLKKTGELYDNVIF